MDITNLIIMLLVGMFGGFLAGMLGIGGAIIIFPAISILPPLFGADSYSAYVASGLTSLQVFFSTLSGSVKARKSQHFSKELLKFMGGGILVGSITGALVADFVNETLVNSVYVVVAILALILMFYNPKINGENKPINKPLLVIFGILIGLLSGVVGAGGAFIVIPVLLSIFKQPMNKVVTNSIIIAFIASIASFVIKLMQGYIPLLEGIVLVVGSIALAPIGMRVGVKTPDVVQKWIISLIILLSIIMI